MLGSLEKAKLGRWLDFTGTCCRQPLKERGEYILSFFMLPKVPAEIAQFLEIRESPLFNGRFGDFRRFFSGEI